MRNGIVIAGIVFLTLQIGSAADTPLGLRPPPGPDEARVLVSRAADAVAVETGWVFEDRALEEILASLLTFSGNFCYPPNSVEGQARCAATVFDESVLERLLSGFQSQVVDDRPDSIEVLGSMLAKEVGLQLEMSGWPSTVVNDFGMIRLPCELDGCHVSVATASGETRHREVHRGIIAKPGHYRLLVSRAGSETIAYDADVTARHVVEVTRGPRTVATSLGRVEAESQFFCYDLRGWTSRSPRPAGPTTPFNWGRDRLVEPDATRRRNLA